MDVIEYLTQSYLKAYNTALRETRNPAFSAQTASAVIMCLNLSQDVQKQRAAQQNPLAGIMQEVIRQQTLKNLTKEGQDQESDGDQNEDQ